MNTDAGALLKLDGSEYSNAEIVERMDQTYLVTGDKWFKLAADRLRQAASQGRAGG